MIARRSSSLSRYQAAISSRVRPQPSHNPVSGSRTQTRMQGVEIVMAHAPISSRSGRDQDGEIGENLRKLLDRPADVSGLPSDQPGGEPRHPKGDPGREDEGEKQPEGGKHSRQRGNE